MYLGIARAVAAAKASPNRTQRTREKQQQQQQQHSSRGIGWEAKQSGAAPPREVPAGNAQLTFPSKGFWIDEALKYLSR